MRDAPRPRAEGMVVVSPRRNPNRRRGAVREQGGLDDLQRSPRAAKVRPRKERGCYETTVGEEEVTMSYPR